MGRPPEPTRFVIWFNQRSGSSYLQSLLDSHPGIFCAPELFYDVETAGAPDLFRQSDCPDPTSFLELLFTPRSDHRFWERIQLPQLGIERAVGLKVKYEQAIAYPLIQAFHATGVRVIHLVRNPLAVHASTEALLQVTARAGDVNLRADDQRGAGSIRVHLDPDLAVWEVYRINQAQQFGRFVCRGLRTLEVHYEDLVADPDDQLGQIQHFLGVDPEPLRSDLAKALPANLADTIENYDEVREALSRTELGPLVL